MNFWNGKWHIKKISSLMAVLDLSLGENPRPVPAVPLSCGATTLAVGCLMLVGIADTEVAPSSLMAALLEHLQLPIDGLMHSK